MQAVEKKMRQEKIIKNIGFEIPDAMNCFQVREKLNSLFCGEARLEETHSAVKQLLFAHLETCQSCCRSFDANVHFRPSGRNRIY